VFDLHLLLVHGEKIETIYEPFNEPENLDHPLTESELIKSEFKTEVNEEPFEKFESREQGGIAFMTSKDFDQNVSESEFPTRKTDFALKHKIKEEPNESNMPLKKFKQDYNQSNHYAKSKTIEKKTNLKMASVKDNTHSISDLNKDFSTVFNCSVCLEVFGERNDLKKHSVKIHGGELNEKSNLNDANQTELSLSKENPKLNYAQLIAEALSNASEGMLVVFDIFKAISSSHPYYRLEDPNWQKSVRYQLTINDSFEKAEMAVIAKGRYWKLSTNSSVHEIKCQLCPAEFLTNKDMDQHITQAHATTEEKPKLTYAQLITEALSNASEGMLVLSDIYKAISSSHPYYKSENLNWQKKYKVSIDNK